MTECLMCSIEALEKERDDLKADQARERRESERLKRENEEFAQRTCDECSGDGWVYNRVEGRGACTCMIEAEPQGMAWIAGRAAEALHSALPLDYDVSANRFRSKTRRTN